MQGSEVIILPVSSRIYRYSGFLSYRNHLTCGCSLVVTFGPLAIAVI